MTLIFPVSLSPCKSVSGQEYYSLKSYCFMIVALFSLVWTIVRDKNERNDHMRFMNLMGRLFFTISYTSIIYVHLPVAWEFLKLFIYLNFA